MARSFPPLSPVRGDPLTFWSFSLQTREQLQADLLRCQAKIEDLEKLLVEKGQVSRTGMRLFAFLSPRGVPVALVLGGGAPPPRSVWFAPETLEKKSLAEPSENILPEVPVCRVFIEIKPRKEILTWRFLCGPNAQKWETLHKARW